MTQRKIERRLPVGKVAFSVTPANAGGHKSAREMDSRFRGNDGSCNGEREDTNG